MSRVPDYSVLYAFAAGLGFNLTRICVVSRPQKKPPGATLHPVDALCESLATIRRAVGLIPWAHGIVQLRWPRCLHRLEDA